MRDMEHSTLGRSIITPSCNAININLVLVKHYACESKINEPLSQPYAVSVFRVLKTNRTQLRC